MELALLFRSHLALHADVLLSNLGCVVLCHIAVEVEVVGIPRVLLELTLIPANGSLGVDDVYLVNHFGFKHLHVFVDIFLVLLKEAIHLQALVDLNIFLLLVQRMERPNSLRDVCWVRRVEHLLFFILRGQFFTLLAYLRISV